MDDLSVGNSVYQIIDKINATILSMTDRSFTNPEQAVQAVRGALAVNRLDFPALYDLDTDGDELVLKLDELGKAIDDTEDENDSQIDNMYLYLVYYLEDDATYSIHAEIVDEDQLEDIMKDEEEDEEDEDSSFDYGDSDD